MTGLTVAYSGQLSIETCWCGMVHGVPVELVQHQRRQFDDGLKPRDIYCPLGHAWVPAGKTGLARERDARRRAEASLTAMRDQLYAERKAHASTKGKLTKTRKRAQAGVCPCCKRSFVQLARHVRSQHPDFEP